MKYFIFSVVVFILAVSCINEVEPDNPVYQFEFPTTPFNLENFNTEYDDYNSAGPILGGVTAFCFSTNRMSQGNQYDVIFEPMQIIFERYTGVFSVDKASTEIFGEYLQHFQSIATALRKITDPAANEFGPYLYLNDHNSFVGFSKLLLYATNANGDFDIKFTANSSENENEYSNPISINFLNSAEDDLYPSFDFDNYNLFFCSNRNGGIFNIYEVGIDITNKELIPSLTGENQNEVILSSVLSSDYDDKCPFFYQNKMVFTSNRPGGFGGFDLYYATLENGVWTAPVNFGPEINTEFDEYRPIILEQGIDYTKYAMVFSSNRAGGKGGFDLYMVGIEK